MYLLIEFGPLCQTLWAFSNFDIFFYFVLILHLTLEKVTEFLVEKLSTLEVISQKPHRGGFI